MEASYETRPLLNRPNQVPQYEGRKWVPIEVVGFLYFTATVFAVPATQFYILDTIEKKYDHGFSTFTSRDSNPCITRNSSQTDNTIEAEKAKYLMYSLFLSCFPAILPVLYLGLFMDKYGRKRPLAVTLSGAVIRHVIYIIVMNRKLRVEYLFIGNIVEGITGYFGGALMGVFSIISDITAPGRDRAFRIAFAEATYTFGASIAQILSGYWIKDNTNYDNVMVVSSALNFLGLIFLIFCIPETHHTNTDQRDDIGLSSFKRSFMFYFRDTEKRRRTKMLLTFIAFFLEVAVHMSIPTLLVLFLQDTPLCWSEFHISTYVALLVACQWIVILVITKSIQKLFQIQDVTVATIGTLSGILFLSILPAADNSRQWLIYFKKQYDTSNTSAGLGCYYLVPASMSRSILSRHVERNEQGSLFAGIACVEMLVTSVAGLAFTQIYRATIVIYRGMIFWVMAGVLMIAFIVFTVLRHKLKKS